MFVSVICKDVLITSLAHARPNNLQTTSKAGTKATRVPGIIPRIYTLKPECSSRGQLFQALLVTTHKQAGDISVDKVRLWEYF